MATNLSAGTGASSDLQAVIDAATAGDRIQVKRLCVGNFIIDKDLTVVGMATHDWPKATLAGDDAGTVLSVSSVAGAGTSQVTLRNLKITHGIGGIYSDESAVTLAGSTSVIRNAKPKGAGIDNFAGRIVLNGSSRVSQNDGSEKGGGIFNRGGGTVILNGSSKVTKNTAPVGGGIYTVRGAVRLNRSSAVGGNVALSGGGISNEGGVVRLNASSTVRRNKAETGGGIYVGPGDVRLSGSSTVKENTARWGGGIQNSSGTVILTDSSSVRKNTARRHRGDLFVDGFGPERVEGTPPETGSTLQARRSAFGCRMATRQRQRSQSASVPGCHTAYRGSGGAIQTSFGKVILKDSSLVKNNSARRGGGIENWGGKVEFGNSASVSGNTAIRIGGGLLSLNGSFDIGNGASVKWNTSRGRGGGIYNDQGRVRLSDSSLIVRNTARIRGGGIFNRIRVWDGDPSKGSITVHGSALVQANVPDNCVHC